MQNIYLQSIYQSDNRWNVTTDSNAKPYLNLTFMGSRWENLLNKFKKGVFSEKAHEGKVK